MAKKQYTVEYALMQKHPELFLLGGGRNTDVRINACFKALETVCSQRQNKRRNIATVLTYGNDSNPGGTGTKLTTYNFTIKSAHLPKLNAQQLEAVAKRSDVLFVKGGNTHELLTEYIRLECATIFLRSNVIIAGNSAGALVHSRAAITDAAEATGDETYGIMECAGTIPFTMDVHHDDANVEKQQYTLQIQKKYPTIPLLGIAEYSALHIKGGTATVHGDRSSTVHIHATERNVFYKPGQDFKLHKEF